MLDKIIRDLIDEGIAARVHFQIWWALRNLALPDYYEAMNQYEYVDFFHASNSGHYKLFFIALSKIFDPDAKTSGIRSLKNALEDAGRSDLKNYIEAETANLTTLVQKVMKIRNQSVAHNQTDLSRRKVYKINGVSPNQIRELIDKTAKIINHVASQLGISNTIFKSDRAERATLKMLVTLPERENMITASTRTQISLRSFCAG